MLPMKLDLTEELAATLRQLRLDHPVNGEVLTAEKLSKAIGNNRAWMSQIESRRLKKIKREDIISIYSLLFNFENEREAEDKAELDLIRFMRKGKSPLLFSYKKWSDDEIHPKQSDDSSSTSHDNKKAMKRLFKLYSENCNEIAQLLLDFYNDKENDTDKMNLSMIIHDLIKLLYGGEDSVLSLMTSIPFDLYQYAEGNEKKELDGKIQNLRDSLNKLEHVKLLHLFSDRIDYITEKLLKNAKDMRSINDSIVVCVMELGDILYTYSVIQITEKTKSINKCIKMLDLYAQKNALVFELDYISEENPTMENLDNAMDYIQSFVNGIKDSYAYLLNHISERYKDTE